MQGVCQRRPRRIHHSVGERPLQRSNDRRQTAAAPSSAAAELLISVNARVTRQSPLCPTASDSGVGGGGRVARGLGSGAQRRTATAS